MENENFYKVLPKKGVKLIHPVDFLEIPATGRKVRKDPYWLRMRDQGLCQIIALKPDKVEEEDKK